MTIGYTFLARDYWGGKYNLEMKTLLLDHAFQFVDEVLFEIGEKNKRSQMAIERLGAKLRAKDDFNGNPHRIYVITKATWS